ncbi:DUF523 domain-containing protein [Clostridium neuense]|uniref:DUF523 domain-containing protein n=1 Tax=Clostridium neuense TaxID=1728934 RepID=A0ABW8TGX6_9CLOT
MQLVSACLCGINCRYSGDSSVNKKIIELLKNGGALPVCPEQLGGLQTPRKPCEIVGGAGKEVLLGKAKVIDKDGNDRTFEFVRGAQEVLNIAKIVGSKKAILKAKSPSCGCGKIYDGTFSGNKIAGNGITAQLLLENGIEVITEEDLK